MAIITIGGVDRTYAVERSGGIVIDRGLNRRATCSFAIGMSVVPAKLTEVLVFKADGVTRDFGGLVLSRDVKGFAAGSPEALTAIECGDFGTYADFAYTSRTYSADVDLEDVIADLVADHLDAYGITYTPTATGVVLAPFSWRRTRVSDAFRELSDRTGKAIVVSPTKVLTVVTLSGSSAPEDLTDAWPPTISEFTWRDASPDPTPTDLILVCGTGQEVVSQVLEADGVAEEHEVDYPVSQNINDVWPNVLILDGVVAGPVGWGPDQLPPGGWYWDYEGVTGKLVNDTGTPLADGVEITVGYTKQMPFEVLATTGVTPKVERLVVRPDVTTIARGQELADGLLAQLSDEPREATADLLEGVGDGFEPGQQADVDVDTRGTVSGPFTITAVKQKIAGGTRLYSVDIIEGDIYAGDAADAWRELLGSSTPSSTVAVVSGGSASASGSGTGAALLSVFLGGSRTVSIAANPAAWTPVPNHLDFVSPVSVTAQVRVVLWARDSGVTVTARLRNVTDSTDVESDPVTSQTPTAEAFTVALVAGKEYRLELLSDTNGKGVYGIGQIQSL